MKEIIDKFYLDKEKDRKNQTSFYISEAGRCPRQIFFKFKHAPKKELEPNILRLFDHGEHMHKLIMKPLLSTRDIHVVASEVDIPPQEIVRGRADAVLSDGKELYVLDIKSMNSMLFRTLQEPKEENVMQIQMYLHYFKISKGLLLYVDKDQLELKEFVVNYNPALCESLISELCVLRKQIDSDIVPKRIDGYPSNKQCQYCQYKEVCRLAKPEKDGQYMTSMGHGMRWQELKEKIGTAKRKEN